MLKSVLIAVWAIALPCLSSEVVARIGDVTIERADVDARIEKTLFDLRVQTYHARRRAALALVNSMVLAREAAARGVSEQEILSTIGSADTGPLYRALRRKYGASLLLEPPRVVFMSNPTLPSRGSSGAKVEIVEFADYECPYCARVHSDLIRILNRYPETKLTFRDFPLPSHPHAREAAHAARCMAKQGQFWSFHDLLFEDKDRSLDLQELFRLAGSVGDLAGFQPCMTDPADPDIDNDLQLGRRIGVAGTPSIFVNGIPLPGTPSYRDLADIVEQELDRGSMSEQRPFNNQ